MKFMRLVTIAALSTIVVVGSGATFADEVREVETKGKIEFKLNDTEEVEVIPPVTDPEVEIKPEKPGTTGPLSIVKAVTMDFGSQVISNKDQTYNMIAEQAPLASDNKKTVPYISFAQVQDVRGTNQGWDLQLSLSNFTSSSKNNVLTGVQLKLHNPSITYNGNNNQNAPETYNNTLTLEPNTGAKSVMWASEGKGAGVSSVVWGTQKALEDQLKEDEETEENENEKIVTNDAIQLFIPGSAAKDAASYTSTLTWELTATPKSK